MQNDLNHLIVELEETIEESGVGANISGWPCDIIDAIHILIDTW